MLTPLPSAAAYWLFGADTRLAELGITAWAIGLVCRACGSLASGVRA